MMFSNLRKSICRCLALLCFLDIGPVVSQTCTPCFHTYSASTGSNISVDAGKIYCISSGVVCSGTITLNGGTLCNSGGTVQHFSIAAAGGTVINSGTITSQQSNITLTGSRLNVVNSLSALMNFVTNVNFIETTSDITISFTQNDNSQTIFSNAISVSNGTFIITNTGGNSSGPTSFKASTGNFGCSILTVSNTAQSVLAFSSAFNISPGSSATINNTGTISATSSFNIGGAVTTIHNNGIMISTGSFMLSGVTNSVFIDGTTGTLTTGNMSVNISSSSFSIGNTAFKVTNDFTLTTGKINNGGAFSATNIYNTGAVFINNSAVNISGNLVNSGTLTSLSASYFATDNFTNTSTGIINTSSVNLSDPISTYPSVIITDISQNSGSISGPILIFDQTLSNNSTNIGYGIDNIITPSSIASSVKFVSTSRGLGNTSLFNCAYLAPVFSTSIKGVPGGTMCPYGSTTSLSAQAYISTLGNPPYSSSTTATYSWMPGSVNTQSAIFSPTSTTIYTITSTAFGCSFTQTLQILVASMPIPVIQYTNTITLSTTATFSVTQSGPTGGTFAITPTCSGVAISPSTGVITCSNMSVSCFKDYTVSYCIGAVTGTGGARCDAYCATTSLTIINAACPFSLVPTYGLCKDDKVQLTLSGGAGTFSWVPSAGLSCTACNTPTLTYSSGTTIYTVSAQNYSRTCGTATVGVYGKVNCQKDDIIGCCFSNYGSVVTLNSSNTYINVYCNLLNELAAGYAGATSFPGGQFQNNAGTIRVLLDWIHNSKNALYTASASIAAHQGTTSLFGSDQNMRGNSHTEFSQLQLDGSGTKAISIDEYGYSTLNLNDNILDLQNFTYAMKNPTTAIARTTGYAINATDGYFSWAMSTVTELSNQKYLFPLGAKANASAPFRYRPVIIANNSTAQRDEISANFMNIAPSFSNDAAFINGSTTATLINNQAPNEIQINHAFYHKIKNTNVVMATSDLAIKLFYLPIDGQYQSVSEWKKDPAQAYSWWGSTPGASASTVISTDPFTPGLIYSLASGTMAFNYKPFALARGGFYINTSAFGDESSPSTIFSLTTTSTGSSSPQSGLNTSFGTGNSSGNSGTGGNTIFSPNPVSGNYVMNISASNNCAVPGKIQFVVDQNGNISPSTVQYGNVSGVFLGGLSGAVYTIDNQNSGITFSATPVDLLRNCANLISIKTSTNNDFVLDRTSNPSETIDVNLPSATGISYGSFSLYNSSSSNVYTSSALSGGVTHLNPSGPFAAGSYRFELLVSTTITPIINETIKGQILIK